MLTWLYLAMADKKALLDLTYLSKLFIHDQELEASNADLTSQCMAFKQALLDFIYPSRLFIYDQELEASNADLASQCMADKKALLDLREELVKEKMGADKLANQLDQVNSQLLAFKDTNVAKVERILIYGENKSLVHIQLHVPQ